MKQIVLFGAGKSATVLIDYLLEHAAANEWSLNLVDADLPLAQAKLGNSAHGKAFSFDITDPVKRAHLIGQASVVISMLPPVLHRLVAADCLLHGRNLLTASYVDQDMRSMQQEIKEKGLLFLCEMGLDPGIDHMSAMALITRIRNEGGRITSFYSHCGGLIAPESDDNPWHYKISWNPRNIVMAGSAGAVYIKDGTQRELDYPELFSQAGQVQVEETTYAWYANRDSLSYMPLYGLTGIRNFIRTTLRHPDFMRAWVHVVALGLSNGQLVQATGLSYIQWLEKNIFRSTGLESYGAWLGSIADDSEKQLVNELFHWIGFDSDEIIPAAAQANVDVLQSVLEAKLQLKPGDRDLIVMLHELEYEVDGRQHSVRSSLVVKGHDNRFTAMAQTVGLPLGIAARLLLAGQLPVTGLRIPTHEAIYQPVLKELEERGIRFNEQTLAGRLHDNS